MAELALDVLVQTAFEVDERDTLITDVAVIRRERLNEDVRVAKGVPDIAIEVVSPTDTVDALRKKIKAYLGNGASSVWVFYREDRWLCMTLTACAKWKGSAARGSAPAWFFRACIRVLPPPVDGSLRIVIPPVEPVILKHIDRCKTRALVWTADRAAPKIPLTPARSIH